MRWWGDGLYNGLPPSLRKLFQTSLPSLTVQMHDEHVAEILWTQEGKTQTLGRDVLAEGDKPLTDWLPKRAQHKPYQVNVLLTAQQALRLQHPFPEAVKENLRQVVGYQLDRLTPFTLENAYYAAQVRQHDKQRKEIQADIWVTPRYVVERIQRLLQARGIAQVQQVAVAGQPTLNLLASTAEHPAQRWSRLPLYLFLGALVVALLAPLAYQYRRVSQIEAALAEVRKTSAEQLAVRDKLAAAEEALNFVIEKRKSSPMALDVVEKLSAILPAHTWVERLELAGNQLEIRGESQEALSLIDTLENTPEFAEVRFKSALNRNKDNDRDRFHLQARVEVTHGE